MALEAVGSSPITHPIFSSRFRQEAFFIVPEVNTGMSPSGKAPDFDSGIRRFESCHPSQFDPLAQLAEQLPFKQWVRRSNRRRVTNRRERVSFAAIFYLQSPKAAYTPVPLRRHRGELQTRMFPSEGNIRVFCAMSAAILRRGRAGGRRRRKTAEKGGWFSCRRAACCLLRLLHPAGRYAYNTHTAPKDDYLRKGE